MRFYDPSVLLLALGGLRNAQSAQAQAPAGLSPTDTSLAEREVGLEPQPGRPNVRLNPNTREWTPVRPR